MPIAARVRAGWAAIREGLQDIFRSPITNPFLGPSCPWHQQKPRNCGLWPLKYPKLADSPHFVYCLGHDLSPELRRHIFAYLFLPQVDIDQIRILDNNRKQYDDRTDGGTFCEIQGIVEIFHRLHEGKIETRGNIKDERGKKVSGTKLVARRVLTEVLQYLGQVITPMLRCHELTDKNLPINSPKLARNWLASLAALAPYLESLTLDMAVTRWYDVSGNNETVQLYRCIASNFPKLKSFGLSLHLSRLEINCAITDPNRCWFLACRMLFGRAGVNYTFGVTEINDSNESFKDWHDRYRTETPWEMFDEQIKQYETAYWRTHVQDDAHRIEHRLRSTTNSVLEQS